MGERRKGTDFSTVSLSLSRRECGSVHTKSTSTSLTLLRGRRCTRNLASARDRSSAFIQAFGGEKYRSQNLQKIMFTDLGMPRVMSIFVLTQTGHKFVGFGFIDAPHP